MNDILNGLNAFNDEFQSKDKQICNSVQKHFNELSLLSTNNSFYFHAGFQYPFHSFQSPTSAIFLHSENVTDVNFPDIVQIAHWAQNNISPFAFDVQFLVLKRNWKKTLKAVIQRYGYSIEMISIAVRMLSVIQAQLLRLDPNFFRILDFDDFLIQPREYKSIISQMFKIDDDVDGKEFESAFFSAVMEYEQAIDILSNGKLTEEQSNAIDILLDIKFNEQTWPIFEYQPFILSPKRSTVKT